MSNKTFRRTALALWSLLGVLAGLPAAQAADSDHRAIHSAMPAAAAVSKANWASRRVGLLFMADVCRCDADQTG